MRNIATPTSRRRVAAFAASVATAAALGAAGPAAGQELPVEKIDPQADIQQAILCEPDGSILRPTALCEVGGPSGQEGDRINPYTEDGTSPGLLGNGGAGDLPFLGPLL